MLRVKDGKRYTKQTIRNKRTGVAILRSDKDVETRSIIRDKKELFLTHTKKPKNKQKNPQCIRKTITILNMYVLNNRTSKHMK